MLNAQQLAFYENNGYLVLENFNNETECNALRERIQYLANQRNQQEKASSFTTGAEQSRDQYFLESANKISFFWEENAEGQTFNKCGHALHHLDPVFHEFSYKTKIFELSHNLGLPDPILMQSMYIFKAPRVGGKVTWHQDATFLYTKPNTLLGLWFALDDASKENGCLWAIAGAHKEPLRSRFLRLPNGTLGFEHFDRSEFEVQNAIPLEVKKGDLIVLHALLPHMSEVNTSDLGRHAYTLHLRDSASEYPKDNWLQC